jgi:hypothetical protein
MAKIVIFKYRSLGDANAMLEKCGRIADALLPVTSHQTPYPNHQSINTMVVKRTGHFAASASSVSPFSPNLALALAEQNQVGFVS